MRVLRDLDIPARREQPPVAAQRQPCPERQPRRPPHPAACSANPISACPIPRRRASGSTANRLTYSPSARVSHNTLPTTRPPASATAPRHRPQDAPTRLHRHLKRRRRRIHLRRLPRKRRPDQSRHRCRILRAHRPEPDHVLLHASDGSASPAARLSLRDARNASLPRQRAPGGARHRRAARHHAVLPARRPVRGRLVRLGPLADALLTRHDNHPVVTRCRARRWRSPPAWPRR